MNARERFRAEKAHAFAVESGDEKRPDAEFALTRRAYATTAMRGRQ